MIKADLKWVFEKHSGSGVYNTYNFLPKQRKLVCNSIAKLSTITVYIFLDSRYSRIPSEVLFLVLLLVLRGLKAPSVYHLALPLWAMLMHWEECSAG